MIDDSLYLVVGTIMVALLIAAWMFPDTRWLDPFRTARPVRRPQANAGDGLRASWAPARAEAPYEPTHVEKLFEARQRSTRRFGRIYAGVWLLAASVMIVLGHYALSMMTASDPHDANRLVLPIVLASISGLAGFVALFSPGRDR